MAAAGLSLLALAASGLVGWRAFRAEYNCFHPRPRPEPALVDYFAPELKVENAVFSDAREPVLTGWYRASTNGRCVILAHGSLGDRASLAAETRLLAQAGFGVATLDLPGHGSSHGKVEWGQAERNALSTALRFVLAQQPELQVGVLGFSMGGHIAIQWAARESRVQAIAVMGTPPDPTEFTRYEYRRFGPLTQWPAFAGIYLGGMDLGEPTPLQLAASLAPRPLLVIMGEQDPHLPATMARKLFDAALQPKQWFVVPKAGHGRYADAAPSQFKAALISFFSASLSPRSE